MVGAARKPTPHRINVVSSVVELRVHKLNSVERNAKQILRQQTV